MKRVNLFAIFCLLGLTGCRVIETTGELKFSGKAKYEFEREENLSYSINGGRENSYCGKGVIGNTFNPFSLNPGEYYIFYRDTNDYFQRKKTKIKIVRLIKISAPCDKCDDDYKVKCTACNATGKREIVVSNNIQCKKCGGDGNTGWIFSETCTECNGNGGWYTKTKDLIKCDKCNGFGKHYCECQNEE